MTRFELRRRKDGLVYRFERRSHPDFAGAFKRIDADLWIVFAPPWGWTALGPEDEPIQGRPWTTLPADQSPDAPPPGPWVSLKGTKSYVYDLVPV